MEQAKRFRALLAELGLNHPDAAKILHVSLRTLHNWLSGRHEEILRHSLSALPRRAGRDCVVVPRVFGFKKHLVVPNDAGGIAHARLSLSGGMVMLGPVADTPFGRHMKQPDEIGGAETQSSYRLCLNRNIAFAAFHIGQKTLAQARVGRELFARHAAPSSLSVAFESCSDMIAT